MNQRLNAFVFVTILNLCCLCVTLVAICGGIFAWHFSQPQPPTRTLLFPADQRTLSPALRPHVEMLLGKSKKTLSSEIKTGPVFVRVVSERFVWADGKLKDDVWLGGRPFVFITHPETLYGRSVVEIYSALGYAPRQMVKDLKDDPQVALVFTYGNTVTPHLLRDGELPERWQHTTYRATWSNLFALVHKMASDHAYCECDPEKKMAPTKLRFKSDRERASFVAFSDLGKKRIQEKTYLELKAGGGIDWEYRALLDQLMGAAEHYVGDGHTELTAEPNGKGYPEFLGPNHDLRRLPDLAIIRLGALNIQDKIN